MHSALVANRTEIEGFSGEGFVAGFPIEELGIGFWLWGMKDLAAE